MVKRMLATGLGLGLTLLGGLTVAAVKPSVANPVGSEGVQAGVDQPSRPGAANAYIYKTEGQARSAAAYYRSQGKIVEGPDEVLGLWQITVSEPASQ